MCAKILYRPKKYHICFVQLEQHISTLLFRYHCVVVPGFGAFLTHEKGARLDAKASTLYPPFKQLSFNAQLTVGDGVLVSHIAASLFKTYEETLPLVNYEVKKWQQQLVKGASLELEGLGLITKSTDGKISFSPSQTSNYLPSSFGLSAVKANPVVLNESEKTLQQKANAQLKKEGVRFQLEPQNKTEKTGLRKLAWKYAAAGLLGVSGLLSTYTSYENHLENKSVAQQEAQQIVNKTIQEATFFSAKPFSLSPIEISLTKKEVLRPSFFIIAGAFRAPENASKKIAELKSKGFKQASYLGPNRWGLHQVSYAAFTEEQEARVFLKNTQKQHAKDAWLLIQKR